MSAALPLVLRYLAGYPPHVLTQVQLMLAEARVAAFLQKRHPAAHEVRSDRALYDFVQEMKAAHLRSAEPLSKVTYDNTLHVIRNALGTHTTVSRVQGGKLKAKREIRVATLFREAPEGFLRMIAAHELAHLRVREHDKSFYQLCAHIEPDYHQLEFETRLYLCHLEAGGAPLWREG
ncbi:YgjP-like metallopeptidase domain-containing protein [Niveibacterium sp. SC-1]|uniref:YgjP-like metallopeptidase domain-containing protein n=1 Tax=Niveibacterium sp. SC-1 TaxID=3135646 RepID=UPI0031205431